MNCKDVARALSEESRLSFQAQDHLRICNRCQELVRLLNWSVPVDPPSTATLQQMAEGMATNLRPVHPVAPAPYFFGAFVSVFVSIVALGVYRMGAFAMAVMIPLEAAAILIVLAISTGLLAYSLVHQMIPGSRHIRAGAPIGLLATVPFWLMLRRGAILSPSTTGAATGLLAGLVGTSVLEIHCPNLDAWHILVSHLGVAMLCALAGLAIGLAAEVKIYAANSPFKRELQGDIK
jgi:hypothetical protein